tara:strand:- start:62 stop:520 length:459 start_codon:yes stop_codon:yes gene_type:complete
MKIYRLILIVLLIMPSACGYKVLNNLDNYKFKIIKYELTGEKKINNILERNFKRFKENDNSTLDISIKGESISKRNIISKNTAGEPLSYETKIVVKLEVYKNGNLLSNKVFSENISYDNLNSKFELKQYENILIKDLIDQMIFKINTYLDSI